jgi:hypothetical protein
MQTFEIPPAVWADRLDEFTNIHDGWLVSIDVLNPDLGAQPEVQDLPLLGISADRIDENGNISISVARSRTEHHTHIIQHPTHVYLERTDEGADAALAVESADGTKTIVRFRAAVLPETVDGVPRH